VIPGCFSKSVHEGGSPAPFPAASAGILAARYLCRKKQITAGFLGAGPEAAFQLEGLQREFTITGIRVWDEQPSRAEAFARKFSGLDIVITNPKITTDCDLLTTTMQIKKPIVKALWVHEGTHINALGAREPGMQELDPTLLALGIVFVLDITRAIRSGEINVPLTKGFFRQDMVAGTLEDVIKGRRGRMTDEEITIFDSSGYPL
jgi:alanine dehydrogenase